MIRDENREAITQKDEMVEQMVAKRYNEMRELGEFETVHEIFGKLPLPRIQKEHYMFLFDSVRQSVAESLTQQENLWKILAKESEVVKKIEVKTYRDIPKDKASPNKNTTKLVNYNFGDLQKLCYESEKLSSNRPIFKCISYLRNQDRKKGMVGEPQSFLPEQQYINFNEIPFQIGDLRLLMGKWTEGMKRYDFKFVDENRVEFSSGWFPSNEEIEKRADSLAKLYLLHLYREEGRKAKQIYKVKEVEQNKQLQIRRIKQEMDIERVKEGEMIEEMDLIKQVYKILSLIEKKMNELAFGEYQKKKGEEAARIKRSLQKLKKDVHQEPSAKNKLKILITYKHKKGW